MFSSERGFIHQVSEPEALDALAKSSCDHRLYRIRLHRALAAHRLAVADHDALLDAADRPPADRAHGGRHDPRRRPLRQGRRSRKILTDDDINRHLAGIRAVFSKFLKFGSGPTDAMMAQHADWLNSPPLHRFPA